MMEGIRKALAWAPLAVGLMVFPACKKSETSGIEYQEDTPEEVAAATKEAFAGEVSDDPAEVAAGVENFFRKLGRSSRKAGPVDVESILSMDGILHAMGTAGFFEGMSSSQKRDFRAGFRKGASNFENGFKQLAFDRHKILKVEELGPGDRLVYVRLYNNELNITMQMRWWLIETKAGWRAYDYEDLTMGIRTVALIGTMMKSGIADTPEPWIEDFIPVTRLSRSMDITDPAAYEDLGKLLEKLRENDLPSDVKRYASGMMTSVLQVGGEFDESIEELKSARDGGFESPLFHYQMGVSLMGIEDYEEALEEFDQHAETFGMDSDALESVSECHLMLGNVEGAREAALLGLEDNPQSLNCLAAMAAASSPEQIGSEQFAARFEESEQAELAYEIAFDYLVVMEMEKQASALHQVIAGKYPDSELTAYCAEMLSIGVEPEE